MAGKVAAPQPTTTTAIAFNIHAYLPGTQPGADSLEEKWVVAGTTAPFNFRTDSFGNVQAAWLGLRGQLAIDNIVALDVTGWNNTVGVQIEVKTREGSVGRLPIWIYLSYR
jgi:hypothetical protein